MPIDPNLMIQTVIQAAEGLKNRVQAELKKLAEQQQQHAALQSSLDTLRKRYLSDRSLIGHLSDWYGPKSLFERGQYLLCVIALSALIGALVSTISTLMAVSASIFCLASYIIDDHYSITLDRDGAFAQDILALEGQLKVSIAAINEYGLKIKVLFTELYSHDLEVIENLKAVGRENSLLHEQTAKLLDNVAALEKITQSIIEDNAQLIEKRGETSAQFKSIYQEVVSIQSSYHDYLKELVVFRDESASNAERDFLTLSDMGACLSIETDPILLRHAKLRQHYASLSKEDEPKLDRLGFLGAKQKRVVESSTASTTNTSLIY